MDVERDFRYTFHYTFSLDIHSEFLLFFLVKKWKENKKKTLELSKFRISSRGYSDFIS